MTDAFVVFQLVVKYLLFRRGFGVVDYFAHMEDQSVNEIIVEFLVTVENETQQIQYTMPVGNCWNLCKGLLAPRGRELVAPTVRIARFGRGLRAVWYNPAK